MRRIKKKTWFVILVGLFLLLLIGVSCLVAVNQKKEYNKYEYHGLPIIEISLNGVNLDSIDRGNKNNEYNNNTLRLFEDSKIIRFDNLTIKGRGNGTWIQNKKPYRIKFKNKENLLGMGKAKKWNLLANAVDDSFLRNEIAFKLVEMLGMEYGFEGKFVELYVDESYRGLYYLTHAVEINKVVVNLKDPNGILVELNNYYGDIEEHYTSSNGEYLVVKDLVNKDNQEIAMKDFLSSFNELEGAIREKDYERIKELIDVRSFAEYFLLSEFSVNPDAYWTSFYFYKDGAKDKIHAGPGWDFDMAFGNRKWGNWLGEKFYSPTEKMIRKQEFKDKEFYETGGNLEDYEASLAISRIVFDLMDINEFENVVREVYQERLLGRKDELIWTINKKTDEILNAAIADNNKWKKNNFREEVEVLVDWVKKRYDYFEEEYKKITK